MATKTKPLNQRIAEKRKGAGKTQQQIADALGIKVFQVSRWENSHRTPSVRSRVALAEVLGCPVTDLI
jgi:HTH-type transcriptional regulator/antitoxin HipB